MLLDTFAQFLDSMKNYRFYSRHTWFVHHLNCKKRFNVNSVKSNIPLNDYRNRKNNVERKLSRWGERINRNGFPWNRSKKRVTHKNYKSDLKKNGRGGNHVPLEETHSYEWDPGHIDDYHSYLKRFSGFLFSYVHIYLNHDEEKTH